MKTSEPTSITLDHVRDYVEYLRDLGVYDFYHGTVTEEARALSSRLASMASVNAARDVAAASAGAGVAAKQAAVPGDVRQAKAGAAMSAVPADVGARPIVTVPLKLVANPCNAESATSAQAAASTLQPLDALRPTAPLAPERRQEGLEQLRASIGDCTRCPLAYAGRHSVVFGEGNASASLMFVGEGPGVEEDLAGSPFVGKAGQLLDNMITAMGLLRADVYLANVVKCRPPQNRVPEAIEASTCSQFLAAQIDIVRPRVVVALGATAATYLLGMQQPLASLRGTWYASRGAKVLVTFHPAFLLRDPRQKGEAWKDLQRVMAELGLRSPGRT